MWRDGTKSTREQHENPLLKYPSLTSSTSTTTFPTVQLHPSEQPPMAVVMLGLLTPLLATYSSPLPDSHSQPLRRGERHQGGDVEAAMLPSALCDFVMVEKATPVHLSKAASQLLCSTLLAQTNYVEKRVGKEKENGGDSDAQINALVIIVMILLTVYQV